MFADQTFSLTKQIQAWQMPVQKSLFSSVFHFQHYCLFIFVHLLRAGMKQVFIACSATRCSQGQQDKALWAWTRTVHQWAEWLNNGLKLAFKIYEAISFCLVQFKDISSHYSCKALWCTTPYKNRYAMTNLHSIPSCLFMPFCLWLCCNGYACAGKIYFSSGHFLLRFMIMLPDPKGGWSLQPRAGKMQHNKNGLTRSPKAICVQSASWDTFILWPLTHKMTQSKRTQPR